MTQRDRLFGEGSGRFINIGGGTPFPVTYQERRSTRPASDSPVLFSPERHKQPSAQTRGDRFRSVDIGDLIQQTGREIGQDFDDEAAALAEEYNRRIAASGGGGDYGIGAALEYLRDIQGNRGAIQEVYQEYGEFIDPIAQGAIDAAVSMVAEGTPELEAIHAAAEAELGEVFDAAESQALAEAELIGAGEAAGEAAAAATGYFRDLLLGQEDENAELTADLLGLQSKAFEKQAIADKALDEGDIERQAHLTDLAFGQMEEQARSALAAARRAASAAAARRRALVAERDAAIAELNQEKYRAMKLNPHEAGEVAAIEFLRSNGGHLPYQRQQLVFTTISNAISEQVPANQSHNYLRDKGIEVSSTERALIRRGLETYAAGSRYQQNQDGLPPRLTGGIG